LNSAKTSKSLLLILCVSTSVGTSTFAGPFADPFFPLPAATM